MSSIRLRLLKWLVGPVVLVNLGAALLAYELAWKPAELAAIQPQPGATVVSTAQEMQPAPAASSVARSAQARAQVRSAVLRTLVLVEVLVCLALAGLVWFSVTNGLAPLARLRASLDRRGSADLEPLHQDGLPQELVPVVDAFNDLLGRIGDSARAQHEFQANVAHQLRTPLAGMKLQLEWLAARHRDDPETGASLALMRQANERLIRETNQLLSLARAEPSRFEAARVEPLDLAGLVEEAVQAFVVQAVARRIDLGFSLAAAPVRGDRFLLRDLLDNLVDNALRYTPPGGTVTVRAGVEGGVARLVVEDNGPGIAPEQRARVFQRFVRLDQNTTGSGLGLAIVRDIAQVHGGEVELSSGAGGKGAVFTVRFPPA
ncbi:HAMP domain-containing histidine kinase [Massilia agilis]|uniref:histidine kinase n=1 Tax=Massilia agilis TaxID=1811226 RepID=A0ABT2D5Z1_9BURK|nr:HAMP domain-containing sensor histidine kinase [Massilia agilis]MCS0806582.1 HAMP domain-containing histidine kinase [Massilia agilis]